MKYEFDAILQKHEGMDAAYIEFPYDVEKEFGKKDQVKVKALFDGFSYRGSLARMGLACHFIGVTKEIRKAIGKNPGDKVHVIIEQDLEERKMELPEDFMERLALDDEAKTLFEKLSYSHQREYVNWIVSAKRDETRKARLEKAVGMLKGGKKEP